MRGTFEKFALVNFQSKEVGIFVYEINKWERKNPFASLENCARQIIVGDKDTISTFPSYNRKDKFNILHGSSAYSYTLDLLLGLKSKRIGEDHIVFQVNQGWDTFSREHPDLETKLRPVKKALDNDTKLIRNKIISKIIPEHTCKAVQILSGQQKDDKALIIGYMTNAGDPSNDMRDIINYFGNNRNGKPLISEISIITNSPSDSEKLLEWINKQQSTKRLHPSINFTATNNEEISSAVEKYDRIYFTPTMGKFPELEEKLRYAWLNRVKSDNTLTLLRGEPASKGHSSTTWLELNRNDTFLPEHIWDTLEKIKLHNAKLVEHAKKSIELCAEFRIAGENPKQKINFPNNQEIEFSLS